MPLKASQFKNLKANPEYWVNPNAAYQKPSSAGLNARLWPGEVIFGDYDGEVLILGQDSQPVPEELLDKKYVNNPKLPFNRNLLKYFENLDITGVLGNVWWFYKNGGGYQGTISKKAMDSESLDANRKVIDATIKGMPKLKKVFILGKNGYEAFAKMYNLKGKIGYFESVKMKKYEVMLLPHSGGRGITAGFKSFLVDKGVSPDTMKKLTHKEIIEVVQEYIKGNVVDAKKLVKQFTRDEMTEKYSPQKHEWGTDASDKYAREITPGEKKKEKRKVKTFYEHLDDIEEAKYQGKEVPLNTPMKGDVSKSKVYVKDGDKVKKVNFGDKSMSIKKDQPARKKSYCARSAGIEGGGKDKTKANYWSRRAWDC